jgi:hypothetical protein
MTTEELKKYAAELLILQYRNQPKARATVEALAELGGMDQLPLAVQDAFTIGTAAGVQLDILGKYVGANRRGYNFGGPVTLSDADFTTIIKIAIAQNSAGSSLADIQALLAFFFPGTIQVFDHGGLRLGYYLNSDSISEELAQFFIRQGSLPRPMVVELSALIRLPSIDNFFGFADQHAGAFNTSGFSDNDGFVGAGWYQNGDFV